MPFFEIRRPASLPAAVLTAALSAAALSALLVGTWPLLAPGQTCTVGGSSCGVGRRLEANITEPPLASGNPFSGQSFYVNPSYAASLHPSIATSEGRIKATLTEMQTVPTAYWLSSKARVLGTGTDYMEGILADAASKSPPQLVIFIVYNLPNRDCGAKASGGEICCTYAPNGRCDFNATGNCAAGLEEYRSQYIDNIVDVLRKFVGRVPISLVIEPDSLPNLVTRKTGPRCGGNSATVAAYRQGITYAIQSIAAVAPQVAMYLDAGNSAWLGGIQHTSDFVALVRELGVAQHLHGLATNVAAYQPLGIACPSYDWCLRSSSRNDPCCADPCGVLQRGNPSNNEANYALHLKEAFAKGISGFQPHIIIDTGRTGVVNMRQSCSNWCNIRGAGVGVKPTASTQRPQLIDAYFWLKTPGESDGCTKMLPSGMPCPRFDSDCASVDSIGSRGGEPRAPEAGQWFDYQVKQLAENADM